MITFAMSGGCIINRRFSACEHEGFTRLIEIIRGADVSFSHLEGTIAEADGAEVYPATEAGWTWIRTPAYFGEELKWAGFDLVSHASNHSLDYMYGGLYSTWSALKRAGVPYAGTGMTLNEARRPAFLENAKGRVALISSSSSTADWARAADPVRDDRGRPGVNQLRLIQVIDHETADQIRSMVVRMGWWMTEVGDDIMISPPGPSQHRNALPRFERSRFDGHCRSGRHRGQSERGPDCEAECRLYHLPHSQPRMGSCRRSGLAAILHSRSGASVYR